MPLPDVDSAVAWNVPNWVDPDTVVDPNSEVSADVMRPIAADVAAATHTQIRATARATCATYTSGVQDITVADHDAVWGMTVAVKPTCQQTSAGVYLFTWAASQTDELGDAHSILARFPKAWLAGATLGRCQVVSWTANTVTVNTYNAAGSADSLNGDWLMVEWS